MKTIPTITLAVWLAVGGGTVAAQGPAYAPGTGPTILVDTGHHNVDGPRDRARVAQWLQNDGYVVRELAGRFTRGVLDGVQVVIIKNPLAERNALHSLPTTDAEVAAAWRLPAPSAFTQPEIVALHDWVAMGGALLLVFDHMPMPGAVRELAAAFGIEVSNGFAVDERSLRGFDNDSVVRAGRVVFRRSDRTLTEDPVTNGRGPAERVESVATNTGSAFRLPREARSLLTLGPSFVSLLADVAWQFSAAAPRQPIGGWSQGGALRVERGRVAVFGDGAILVTPDMAGSSGDPAGISQNPQLLLNVVHWLSGLLERQ